MQTEAGRFVLRLYKRQTRRADLLSTVTDSLGATARVSYLPMVDRRVHTPAADNCTYPRHCPRRGGWLVREVIRDTGSIPPTTWSETHEYAGARLGLGGRGWLGFAEHTMNDSPRDRRTTWEMDNVTAVGRFFPFAGLVARERVRAPSDDIGAKLVTTDTRTSWINTSGTPERLAMRPDRICEARSEHARFSEPAPGDLFADLCTYFREYDAFSFPRITERTGGIENFRQETTYEHRDTATPRLLGIVRENRSTSLIISTGAAVTRTVSVEPDFRGLPRREIVEPTPPPGSPPVTLVTEYVRNDVGQVAQVTTTGESGAPHPVTGAFTPEPQSRTSFISYDAFGYPRRIINPLGHIEEWLYEPSFGMPAVRRDANGVTTRSILDGFGRLRSQRSAFGTELNLSYTANADSPLVIVAAWERRAGPEVQTLARLTTHHDLLGRDRLKISAAPRSRLQHVFTRYDAAGRVFAVSAPQFAADEASAAFGFLQYDGYDRLLSQRDPDGVPALTISYDRLVSTFTNARGKRRRLTHDAFDYLLESRSETEAGELRGRVTLDYAPFGQTARRTIQFETGGPESEIVSDYDLLGRPTRSVDPDRGTYRLSHNAFHEPVHTLTPDGVLDRRRYDQLGRLGTILNEDGVTRFEHDGAPGGLGQISRTTSPDRVSTRHRYDALARPIEDTTSIPGLGDFAVARRYDPAGRLAALIYPLVEGRPRFEVALEYSASAGANLWRVSAPGSRPLWQAEDHDPYGQLAQEVFGNSLRVRRELHPITGQLQSLRGAFVTDPFFPEGNPGPIPGLPLGAGGPGSELPARPGSQLDRAA